MGAKPYPVYKDSGVEWIGEIPEHWEVKRLKNHIESKSDVFVDGDWIESPYITDNGYRLVQTGNVGIGRYKEQGNRYISPETFKQLRCTEVLPDDLLICRLADPVGRACMAPDLGVRMVTSVDVAILRLGNVNQHQYLTYFFSSSEYLLYMESVCRGGTRDRVSRSFLGSVFLPSPPLEEQKQIASFLDRETSKIDTLIEKQQQLINLLKEKRGSLISHTVTKGLNPNVPMKDSGVEWIGEIPEHWEVKRLKDVADCNSESLSETTNPSNEIDYIEISDVSLERGIEKFTRYEFSNAPSRARRIVREGDVVISTVRTYLKAISSVSSCFDGMIVSTGFAVLRPIEVEHKYLSYGVVAEYFIALVISQSIGVSYPSIRSEDLLRCVLPIPPLEEQKQIAAFLDRETSKIDTLIEKANQSITLLKERRSSLISAAVTGKIDVREAA